MSHTTRDYISICIINLIVPVITFASLSTRYYGYPGKVEIAAMFYFLTLFGSLILYDISVHPNKKL